MISFLSRLSFSFIFLCLMACSSAPADQPEEEPVDSTTHFNDSTEAV